MAIVISKNGKDAKKIQKSNFDAEDYLQQYIFDNPESIPLYEIKEDIRLLILAREFSTDSGPIDALGVDKDGEVYLVETKLYKNPDKRLVVAQVLDYGASLWRSYSDSSAFISEIEGMVTKKFKVALKERLQNFFKIEETEVTGIIESMRANLSHGTFKFVVMMDKLHNQLKDLILYLNQNSRFDIYAVELEYYKFDAYEIMIPKLFGAEIKKTIDGAGSQSARRKWTEEDFFQDAKTKLSEEELKTVRQFYDKSKVVADSITWGSGAFTGSFNVKFDKVSLKSLYYVQSDGYLVLCFRWLDNPEDARKYRDRFLKEIQTLKSLPVAPDSIDKFVYLKIDQWGKYANEIIAVVKKTLQ